MILHAEDRPTAVPHSFQGAVIKIGVGWLKIGRQFVEADGEAVILRCNFHALSALIKNRLIRAAVSEL